MNEEILKLANQLILWPLCAVVVLISLIQAILYTRLANKTAKTLGITSETCQKAFKAGLITAIGPAISGFIVMVGMISVIGAPMSWMRLSIIGAATTEMAGAQFGAEAMGVKFGGPDYNEVALVVSWITMAANGCGWLISASIMGSKLEKLRTKISGGNQAGLALLSAASMVAVFGNLASGYLPKIDTAASVLAAALTMFILVKFVSKTKIGLKIREYNLGIAMLVGMAVALIVKISIGG
ncbi:DUF5058 family protein [Brachyspira pilosicoli]|uniref:DUF5058 family protein n=5 Tax=Brachyspira pilosicoli TaxID=52584 RepID=D8IF10_BRAP9|nr:MULTISPECIES: DUF5058 family protein [Brachyspira]ADK31733.1 conserved hypothetical protein [Brachyspira pilosicoli 95/1000]AFR71595.1 putative membrane protein [Brachyspira pilosicoli B2904]AGA66524.1 hypothetical protein BPP43_06420 [Brachyspira pilosicoli P43/6/78]MBW5378464.1 DUF5058 family protein [Brachyspira pilosicoli]MBW5391691.1 DUF5058 family protein [Brachyspira pilosicoli]